MRSVMACGLVVFRDVSEQCTASMFSVVEE
jgi:hypothetical protein